MNVGSIVLTVGFALLASACQDEGPAERAGRQIDESIEEMRSESEGALERLGREVDEAVEETREAADAVEEAAEEARP